MKKPDISRPTILSLLDAFCTDFRPVAKPGTRKRLDLVIGHLRQFLESDADNVLIQPDFEILMAERQLDPVGAFERTMHADDLFYALPQYLAPERALTDPLARRAQIDLVANLCSWLWEQRYLRAHTVSECAVIDMEVSLRRSRDTLRVARHASSLRK